MKKYIFSISLIFSLLSFSLIAQQKSANISFDKTNHNFGEIKEADGEAIYKFEFTNTGSEPLIIQRVSASCGCTTPNWTKEPVMPGEKGFVSAAYNPAHRPGAFNKSITVSSNAATPAVGLTIEGNVIPKPLSIEEQYRYDMGGIRSKTNHVSFGTINKGQTQSQIVEVINNTDETKTLEIKNAPKHIQIKVLTPKIKAGEKGSFEVTYLSELQPNWDFVIDRVDVYVNGQTSNTGRLIISASLQEDFSSLSADELAKAPNMEFKEKVFDFGKLSQGEKVDYTFNFKNSGLSDLIIRNVRASCGCTAVNTSSNLIKAGESGSIKVTFNSAGKMGTQNKTITLITNDPKHSREILWIKGEVIKE
jgi:uncharacterized protein DUF1573